MINLVKKELIKISPDDTILEAYHLMFKKNIRHLPVFDQETLVGMLSDRDIQRAMVVNKSNELNLTISLSEDKKVEEYMSWPIVSVLESASLRSVIAEMIKSKISAVMVQSDELKYVGILTTEDILFDYFRVLDKDVKTVKI